MLPREFGIRLLFEGFQRLVWIAAEQAVAAAAFDGKHQRVGFGQKLVGGDWSGPRLDRETDAEGHRRPALHIRNSRRAFAPSNKARVDGSGTPGSKMPNASPQSRATVPLGVTCSRKMSATSIRSSSPTKWPNRSFTCLKLSQSSTASTANGRRTWHNHEWPIAWPVQNRLDSPVP